MNKQQSVAYIPGMPIYRDVEVLQETWNKVVLFRKRMLTEYQRACLY